MKKYGEIFLIIIIFILFGSTSIMASEVSYTVKSGDSLWEIAVEHGVTVEYLMKINNLQSDRLNIGDILLINADNGNTQNTQQSALENEVYIVKSGDCLSLIADHFGTSVENLMQLNQLNSDFISVGQEIRVTAAGDQNNAEPAAAEVVESVYIVQSGDCLGSIAQKYFMNISQLKSINGLTNDIIYPGQKLIVGTNISTASNTSVVSNTTAEVSRSGSNIDGPKILETAAKYLGVPYTYGGTSPAGFDCSGYVQYVFRECGYQLPRVASAQYQQGTAVNKADLVMGDLVFFACHSSSIDHVGIYAGNNRFIHASSPRSGGVIYTSMDESFYTRSYVGARRIIR